MDVAARAGTASIEARATRMGRRQRWGRIYLLKTPGELKSSVLAPSGRSMAAAALAVNRSCTRLGPKMDAEWRNGGTAAGKGQTAGGGTRTHTDLRPGAFEAPSSTIPTLRRRHASPTRVRPGEYIRVRSLGTY